MMPWGVNAELSYKNTPFAWSPSGWGLFINTPAPVSHSVGYAVWSQRAYTVLVEDHELDLFFIYCRKRTTAARYLHQPNWKSAHSASVELRGYFVESLLQRCARVIINSNSGARQPYALRYHYYRWTSMAGHRDAFCI